MLVSKVTPALVQGCTVVFKPAPETPIDAYFLALLGVVAAFALSSAARVYTVVTLGERVVADLRSAVFARLTQLDPAFFDRAQSGEIVSRLTADATQIKSAFGVSVSILLSPCTPSA